MPTEKRPSRHEGHRERLRNRVRTYGIGSLEEHEQLEYILYAFIPRKDTNPIAHDLITGVDFLKEGFTVDVVSDATTETILFAELPTKVELAVTYTEPGLKGDTATNTLKPATLETGAEIRVPLFINEGEIVRVDTRDGSYCERVR